ncbi:MAG: hypothetical protein KBG40_01745 [Bacteroidales bacterium]|nr:hypothetical protein [Bacteroidales bacterium]
MHKSYLLVILLFIFSACNKTEDNIIWERTIGEGEAFCIASASDTGIICGGTLSGKPYLLFLNSKHERLFEYKSDTIGSFTAIIPGDSSIISTGSAGESLLISFLDYSGNLIRDIVFSYPFAVEKTSLVRTAGGSFLAVGSRGNDTVSAGNYGLAFVVFDESGEIIRRSETLFDYFFEVESLSTDDAGNFYLAASREGQQGKMEAIVAAYDGVLRPLWEKELYNNPDFGASSRDIICDNSNNIYISGYTEFPVSGSNERAAFAASVSNTGEIRWKKYLEYSNESSSLFADENDKLYVLNSRCLIVNILNSYDGTITGIIRTYSACDPSRDNAYGNCMIMGYSNELVIGGSKNNLFYIVIKSPDILSPI